MTLELFKRALRKPPAVVAFRACQELQLSLMRWTGAWGRLSEMAEAFFTKVNAEHVRRLLLADRWPQLTSDQREYIRRSSNRVLDGKWEMFGVRIPDLNAVDFCQDWRYSESWPNRYFKDYRFYENKIRPYDVKFPWELSRFQYLVPVIACQAIESADARTLSWIDDVLRCWREQNPLARSVNWYPMEASMRVVNLIWMRDFALRMYEDGCQAGVRTALLCLLRTINVMLFEHGSFVWRNREFTDIRGNHFTANVVALLLAGMALDGHGQSSTRQWVAYARKWLPVEIENQFHADGVNFEKSCSYHKLVLELFAIAEVAARRADFASPLDLRHVMQLAKAANFSQAVTRPDGVAANFGDTDDAMAIPFIEDGGRRHGQVVELMRTMTGEVIGKEAYRSEERIAALLLFPDTNAEESSGERCGVGREVIELHDFDDGGYIIVKNRRKGFFCMMDVGDVGMHGLGGHGHNDAMSLEIVVGGKPFIVDPGSPTYTGDLGKKQLYRSTTVHNVPNWNKEESARILGHWRIADDAMPVYELGLDDSGSKVGINVSHNGYSRLQGGGRVTRHVSVDSESGCVQLDDSAEMTSGILEQVFLLHPDVSVDDQAGGCVCLTNQNVRVSLIANTGEIAVQPASYSEGYGRECQTHRIVVRTGLDVVRHSIVRIEALEC